MLGGIRHVRLRRASLPEEKEHKGASGTERGVCLRSLPRKQFKPLEHRIQPSFTDRLSRVAVDHRRRKREIVRGERVLQRFVNQPVRGKPLAATEI
jgi:hypothetical protein